MFTRETPLSRVAQQERKSEIFGHGRKAKPAPRRGKVLLARLIFFCDFLHGFLGFGDPKRNMEFQRVHRIGKSVLGKSRPILTRFYLSRSRDSAAR